MIRQRLKALDQKAHQPLECDTYRATDTAPREPLHPQACDESASVLRDKVLFDAVDKLTPTVVALMVLFAVVKVTVFLVLGGLTPRADVLDDPGLLLTSAGWGSVLVNNSTEPSGQHYMDITTVFRPPVEMTIS
jgi:hypothetical protein